MWQIVFFRRHPANAEPRSLPQSQPSESLKVEDMSRRILELEERLDATEHVLMRKKVEQPRT